MTRRRTFAFAALVAAFSGVASWRLVTWGLPDDAVLFARARATYRLGAGQPPEPLTDALESMPAGTRLRALRIAGDSLHRPIVRVVVLEGENQGKKGFLARTQLAHDTSWALLGLGRAAWLSLLGCLVGFALTLAVALAFGPDPPGP